MDILIKSGLPLTGMGMSIVFIVLAVIFIAIVILNKLEKIFPYVDPTPKTPVKKPPMANSTTSGPNNEEQAAIKAALAHHLEIKPNQFDIIIK
jgi:sodium pump decarboxylase gamma subunit